MVAKGAGHGLLPARVPKAFGREQMQKVRGAPEFQDHICLVYKNEFRQSARGKALIDSIVSSFKAM